MAGGTGVGVGTGVGGGVGAVVAACPVGASSAGRRPAQAAHVAAIVNVATNAASQRDAVAELG